MRELLLHPVLATGGVRVDFDWPLLVLQFCFFVCFVLVMKPLVFEPLVRVFEERNRRTAGAIDDARRMDERAIGLKQELDRKMDGVCREAAVDRDRYRTKVKALEAEKMAAARAEVHRTLEEGSRAIGLEVEQVRRDLGASQDELAAQIASRVLGRDVRAS